MTLMPKVDQRMEQLWDAVFHECPAEDRDDVSRIALLAVQYRINQAKQRRMARAIDMRAAERRALKSSRGDGRDYGPAGSESRLSPELQTQAGDTERTQ